MKISVPSLASFLGLLLISHCQALSITASNDAGPNTVICTDVSGRPIRPADSFISLGTFTLTDLEIAQKALTLYDGAASLARNFQHLGTVTRGCVHDLAGLVAINATQHPSSINPDAFVYIVLHNRQNFGTSSEILVYKSVETFRTSKTITLSNDLSDGRVLLGTNSPTTATIPGYAFNRPTLRCASLGIEIDEYLLQWFGPGYHDYYADADGDGLDNYHENLIGSNPRSKDTDLDGLDDRRDPHPTTADFDGDEDFDVDELRNGTDPNNSASYGASSHKLANHWRMDGTTEDQLRSRRLQSSAGSAAYWPSLNQSARSLAVPLELEAWQLPPANQPISLAFWWATAAPSSGGDHIVKMPGLFQLSLPGGAGTFRLEGTGGTVLNAGPTLPDGRRHHLGLVLRPGVQIELYVDGVLAGGVPLDVNTANAALIFGGPSSPFFIDDLILWERAASPRDFHAAQNGGADSLYTVPSVSPLTITSLRHGRDAITTCREAELQWSPSVGASSYNLFSSDDLIHWNLFQNTTDTSAIINAGCPGPDQLFFRVAKVP